MAGTSPPTWRLSREDEAAHQAPSCLVGARLITVDPEAVTLHCPRLRPGPAGATVGRVQRRELALRCAPPGDADLAGHHDHGRYGDRPRLPSLTVPIAAENARAALAALRADRADLPTGGAQPLLAQQRSAAVAVIRARRGLRFAALRPRRARLRPLLRIN